MRIEKKRRIRGVCMGFFNKLGLCTKPSAALRSLPTQPSPNSHLPPVLSDWNGGQRGSSALPPSASHIHFKVSGSFLIFPVPSCPSPPRALLYYFPHFLSVSPHHTHPHPQKLALALLPSPLSFPGSFWSRLSVLFLPQPTAFLT